METDILADADRLRHLNLAALDDYSPDSVY
jgi:hypothetical protein